MNQVIGEIADHLGDIAVEIPHLTINEDPLLVNLVNSTRRRWQANYFFAGMYLHLTKREVLPSPFIVTNRAGSIVRPFYYSPSSGIGFDPWDLGRLHEFDPNSEVLVALDKQDCLRVVGHLWPANAEVDVLRDIYLSKEPAEAQLMLLRIVKNYQPGMSRYVLHFHHLWFKYLAKGLLEAQAEPLDPEVKVNPAAVAFLNALDKS